MNRDLLLLKLQSLIADKNWIVATANYETMYYEQWQADWQSQMSAIEFEINHIYEALERGNK